MNLFEEKRIYPNSHTQCLTRVIVNHASHAVFLARFAPPWPQKDSP
jgi:hypothetical protein